MATSGGNNLMTYHQFLAAEQQQQAAEGGIFQSDSCHKFAQLPCSSLLPHSEGKCVSGVQSAREYEQVNIFRKKKYDPLSLFILIDDVDNTARWSNGSI